jgi:DNA-binding CsgD family transcriptional regulator/tetratricopeptide (TPR) repeat protein
MRAALAAFVPGLDDTEGADDTTPEFAEAIEALLETLSVGRHLLIVVEDLQWADTATLALLRTLATTLRGRHLTIVATYRSDDIDRFHPLRPVLAELDRTRAIVRIEVTPLTSDEVVEQVRLLDGASLPDDDIRALADRSGGIPFLVEELVDVDDDHLPDTLRDLVLARYERLGDETRALVRTMAAGGVRVDHAVLTAVAGLADRDLDPALREAIDARVITADGDGYVFRHALTREAVESEMLPSEQVRVHRRYAQVLTDEFPDATDAVSAAAEHWLAAHELPHAFDTTVRALEASRATFAPAASVKLLERLTELWGQVPDAASRSGLTLADLHLQASIAWQDLGEPERSLRAANEGLSAPIDDPVLRAGLLRQRFVGEYNSGRKPDRAMLHEVVELLEGDDDPRAKTLLSRTLSNIALGHHDASARQHLRRAVELAEESGSTSALAIALTNDAWRLSEIEDDEAAALAPLERARALDLNPSSRADVGSALADMLNRLGRYAEAAEIGAHHVDDAIAAGLDHGLAGDLTLSTAHALFSVGRTDDGLAYAQRARRLLDRGSRIQVVRELSTHYSWNGEADTREALRVAERATIDEARRRNPTRIDWWVPASVDAVIAAAAGLPVPFDDGWPARFAAVEATLRRADAAPQAGRYAAIVGALMVRAVALTRPAVAADEAAALRAEIEQVVDGWPDRGTAPVLARFITAIFADADHTAAADRLELWRAVLDGPDAATLPVRHRHLAELSLAASRLAAGDREGAAAQLAELGEAAAAHGVGRIGAYATELAAHAGLTAEKDAPGGVIETLTPRERQVLALIAEGLTNAQIGERLFISPKTASVHVSAILAKVGAGHRAQAAALYTALTEGAGQE